MKESIQQSKQLSRTIQASGRNQKVGFVDNRDSCTNRVIQRMQYDNRNYLRLFQGGVDFAGSQNNFFLPEVGEPHLHGFGDGIVLTEIGHGHSYLTNNRDINVAVTGAAKDYIRDLQNQQPPGINPQRAYSIIGALNNLIHMDRM